MSTAESSPRRIVPAAVVGGGVSGLIAARELAIAGFSVTLLEATGDLGGCVAAHEVAGLVLDAGAESFATRSSAVADLLEDLGLGDEIVYPAGGGAWLYSAEAHGPSRHGRDGEAAADAGLAQPLPQTGILGIPGDPLADDVRALIGQTAALRAAADLAMPVSKSLTDGPMSLGALVRSRMGSAVLDALVTPVVSGVHSADPDTLDVDVVAPGLRAAVVEHGSLARAVAALRRAAPAGSAVAGIRGGDQRLTQALVADLEDRGVELRRGVRVTRLRRHDDGYTVSLSESAGGRGTSGPGAAGPDAAGPDSVRPDCATPDEALEVQRLVVATDGPSAVDLLGQLEPALNEHRPEAGAGVRLVTLVVDRPELDEAPRGSGVLVAPDASDVAAKALTHATAKWQWLAEEAGPGTHVLRLSYGRLSEERARVADADDATLYATALADAGTLLGLALTEADVLGWDVVRYRGALPFATTGHRRRVETVREILEGFPQLDAVGAWLSGTGLAAVVADTRSRTRISVS
ncbi:protoporphyrinogen oxidase [Zhihengliuella alba]|uniref:Protoporphyrinogen oxidase n=1 Tax=Zhihengliuella alba TaxID=547018 RepID=A0ABP7CYN1_9MICC